jgi:hypothetical protein
MHDMSQPWSQHITVFQGSQDKENQCQLASNLNTLPAMHAFRVKIKRHPEIDLSQGNLPDAPQRAVSPNLSMSMSQHEADTKQLYRR